MITIYKSKNIIYSKLGNLAYWFIHKPFKKYLKLTGSKRTRVIILDRKLNEILIVKNWLTDGGYQFPGGGLKKHEKPEFGAAREIDEELGIKVDPKLIRWVKTVDSEYYQKVFMLLEKKLTEESLNSLQILRHEITEVIKLKLSELDSIKHKLDEDSFDLLKTIDL
jgi:8-oxo-dGTP pyrophosphatase MutT (NUDIX family)